MYLWHVHKVHTRQTAATATRWCTSHSKFIFTTELLQCFDTVGGVTRGTAGPWKPVPFIPKGTLPETVKKESQWKLADQDSPGKRLLKWRRVNFLHTVIRIHVLQLTNTYSITINMILSNSYYFRQFTYNVFFLPKMYQMPSWSVKSTSIIHVDAGTELSGRL